MAGQPQENPWSQQGQGYPQGAPGYGPAYDQQGQPAPYPPPFEQQPYEPPQYEQQTAIYEQQPEYGYPPQPQQGQPHPGQPQPGPPQGQPHSGIPHPGQPQSQEQQDWENWQVQQQSAQQPSAQRQARGQNRNQGQRPKPSSGQQGFISSLFDFGFNSFVTPKIIKALYAVVAAWTILWAIILLFIGNKQWGLSGLLVMLIIVDPLLILVSLGLLRVVLEFFMITFRMQEDLKAIRERSGDADTVVGRVSGPDA